MTIDTSAIVGSVIQPAGRPVSPIAIWSSSPYVGLMSARNARPATAAETAIGISTMPRAKAVPRSRRDSGTASARPTSSLPTTVSTTNRDVTTSVLRKSGEPSMPL
jgi:hypothetical protein